MAFRHPGEEAENAETATHLASISQERQLLAGLKCVRIVLRHACSFLSDNSTSQMSKMETAATGKWSAARSPVFIWRLPANDEGSGAIRCCPFWCQPGLLGMGQVIDAAKVWVPSLYRSVAEDALPSIATSHSQSVAQCYSVFVVSRNTPKTAG